LPADPWEFIRKCVVTFDERAGEKNLAPERRFPNKAHLELLCREWQAHSHLAVEKSSQILVTWLAAALCLHEVLTKRGQRIAWFCRKRGEAADHVKGRVYRIYTRIPREYALPVARIADGELLVYHDGAEKLPTSRIVPMAAETDGADNAAKQMRSQTWTRTFEDESAFYRTGEDMHYSLLPRTGKYVKVSTPNGLTFFRRLMHGDELIANGDVVRFEMKELRRGMWGWEKTGFRCVRVLHWTDAEKDAATPAGAAWYAGERPRFSERKWQREMNCSSDVAAGEPVYEDTDRINLAPQAYRPWLKLVRWWDFGPTCSACGFMQVEEEEGSGQQSAVSGQPEKRWRVHLLYEVIWRNARIEPMAEQVLAETARLFPQAQCLDFGDPGGKAAHESANASSVEILGSKGIHVGFRENEARLLPYGIELVQWFITQGMIEADPVGAPLTLRALLGGYSRDEHGIEVKDGVYDHPADGLRYGFINLFRWVGRSATGRGGRVQMERIDLRTVEAGRAVVHAVRTGLMRPGER